MYLTLKRFADVIIGVTGLVILSPVFAIIMLVLRTTGEGEIFYRQKRVGYKNRPFGIWKFATMLKNSPNMGSGSLTLRNDPRVTPAGRFLRKSKLNELPQLINLITGEMSLIGPRPQMQVDFEAYPVDIQKVIYNVKPGITGIGSILFRDEERLLSKPGRDPRAFYVQTIAPYKGLAECWYQQNMSPATDVKLFLLTFWAILQPKNRLVFSILPNLPALPANLSEL